MEYHLKTKRFLFVKEKLNDKFMHSWEEVY